MGTALQICQAEEDTPSRAVRDDALCVHVCRVSHARDTQHNSIPPTSNYYLSLTSLSLITKLVKTMATKCKSCDAWALSGRLYCASCMSMALN